MYASDKENIALIGGENSAIMIDADEKPMLGAHTDQMALTPSDVSFPLLMPKVRDDNSMSTLSLIFGDCIEDRTMKQKSNECNDEGAMAMASTHDSPPKLPFYNHAPYASADSEIRRPVALRPASLDAPKPLALRFGPLPAAGEPSQEQSFHALEISLTSSASASRDQERSLPNVPRLRVRPIVPKNELKMSSPLARRGAEERAYLQGQLKAEALRRRKQEHHNAQRKLRENASIKAVDGFKDEDNADEDILAMIEKFKFGFGGICHPKEDNLKFMPRRKNTQHDLRELAGSPPAILKATFKRSVSAVLADSGMPENSNSNLLFFPDGVPLLNEEEERTLQEVVVDGTAIDSESLCSSHGKRSLHGDDDRSFDLSENGLISQSPLTDELTPTQIAADVIWQLGSISLGHVHLPTQKGNHKVTLRPKMNQRLTSENAPKNNFTSALHPASQCISSYPQPKSVTQANMYSSDLISDDDVNSYKFESPDKFCPAKGDILAASESFQQLSFDNEERPEIINHAVSSSKPSYVHQDGNTAPFEFSSPEAGFNHQMFKARMPPPQLASEHFALKEPLSEHNYRTPDNSEHQRLRKRLGRWMPKLPELDMIDSNAQEMFQGETTLAVEEENAFVLKEPLSESTYCTPDNSEHKKTSRKHLEERITKLDERMPKLPEFAAMTVKEPLHESNFVTPDHSLNDRRPSRQQLGRMPKLPELGLAQSQNERREQPSSLEGEGCSMHHHDAVKTPC